LEVKGGSIWLLFLHHNRVRLKILASIILQGFNFNSIALQNTA
jgi:hypothetical protein